MKLSLEAVRNLAPGQTVRDHDPRYRGLELRARAGVKSWHLYYRFEGQQRRPKLGEFPQVSIEAARAAAKEWLAQVAKGDDPSKDRQAKRHAPTVDDLCDLFLRDYAPANYAAKTTLPLCETILRHYVRPELGKLRVADVGVSDVNRMLERIIAGQIWIVDRGKRRLCAPSESNAFAARRFVSKMFSLAEGESLKWRPRKSNPCGDEESRSIPQRKRRVHLRREEFAAINSSLMALWDSWPYHVACIYAVLLCGSRVTEMATARRTFLRRDVDGIVEMNLTEHKTAKKIGDRSFIVPSAALAIMGRLVVHDSGFIFGPLALAACPRTAIWNVWNLAREAAGIRPEVTLRDLRRTFASIAKSRGAKLDQIGDLLGHTDSKTTEFYAFLFRDSAAELTEAIADEMTLLLEGPKS